ncbi:tyrosinase family protein [Rhodococcus sp. NPDC060086]|uniref:tyrosinase family protein n=1 Tax=Rhodococcus sp. NPDC060086 TaxID=3347055 RepID=UPI00365DB67F
MSAPTIHVRKDVWKLDASDRTLQWYAKAVEVMQARPATDPTSWAYQAAIHGTDADRPPSLSNSCMHGTWYFLSWHRMYVYRFEQIARAAVVEAGGPQEWALPYWNYGIEGESATLHPAFRQPTVDGRPNPLYVARRNPPVNDGVELPSQITSAEQALARQFFTGSTEFGGGITDADGRFFAETGQLEATPHNVIHVAVGGRSGWMSNPETAALDPIFWLHHANIDRLWALWDSNGHKAPEDLRWIDQQFELFDVDGNTVTQRCGDVTDTVEQLGYGYDGLPSRQPERRAEAQVSEGGEPEFVGASESAVVLTGRATEPVVVDVDQRAQQSFRRATGETSPRIQLSVENIEGEQNPGTIYAIYVHLPEDPSDEHYVGNLSFFGIERAMHPRGDEPGHGMRVAVDITDVARRMGVGSSEEAARFAVTFRPIEVGSAGDTGSARREALPEVTIGRISISYTA